MKAYNTLFLYILLEIVVSVTGNLNRKLKYFEIIESSDISHQIRKRDVTDENHEREITLSVLGRTLNLQLVPKLDLFSDGFKAVTVDSNGTEREFFVNKNEFYQGVLKGEERRSSVSAHVHNNILTAAIETENDTYHVEPASGHVSGDTTNKMIAYRDSDVIWNITFSRNHTEDERFCGVDANATKALPDVPGDEDKLRSTRQRRSTNTKLTCRLTLVADSLYYKRIGEGDKKKTTFSMVGVISRVDSIFRETNWSEDKDDPYKNYGFEINKVIVHDSPNDKLPYTKVYNNRPWEIKSLLEAFSSNDWSGSCLAHLFTYQDFAKGVIGLAYVGHAEENSRGGICSPEDNGMWHNTGLSSSVNWGNQLLTTEADIVTAHGHNFGSEHDVASDSKCSPETGGKYIMYPASVSGRKPNNNKFSSCSRRYIKEVLKRKSYLCFSVPSDRAFCGNYRVEKGEECDVGTGSGDPCCTSNCRLTPGAKCSAKPCCSNCQIANTSTLCSPAQPLLCRKASYCNGVDRECPPPKPSDEGTNCIERGKCDKNGECKPFCQTINPRWQPCLCSDDENACFVCCMRNNKSCQVYSNNSGPIAMEDGRLCHDGVCVQKKCQKEAQDIITRLQDFFDTLSDPSKFGEFLKDNIVGTVIVFSLIVWIPISIVVNRIDKRRDKHAQELASWQDIQNQDLIRNPNRRRDFDVVFKKDAVVLRDSQKAAGRGMSPNRRRGPTVE